MAILATGGTVTHTDAGAKTAQTFDLDGMEPYAKVRVVVEVTGAVTGTTPTLDYAVAWSGGGGQYAAFSTETALTQQTAQGAEIDELTFAGRYLRLTPTVGGTATPTFNDVQITIVA